MRLQKLPLVGVEVSRSRGEVGVEECGADVVVDGGDSKSEQVGSGEADDLSDDDGEDGHRERMGLRGERGVSDRGRRT